MRPLADAACELPWLAPCAASLVALTREPGGGAWLQLRNDPGLVLLLVRQASQSTATSKLPNTTSLLHDCGVVELALRCLDHADSGFADWRQQRLLPIYCAAIFYARAAEAIAGKLDPENSEKAWMGGLLAPLGWLATAAVDSEKKVDSGWWLVDGKNGKDRSPNHQPLATNHQPLSTNHQPPSTVHCPLSTVHSAIARRLAIAWRLPTWLAAVVGHLGLPLEAARALGADPHHFLTIQLAVALVEEAGLGLHLPNGATCSELGQVLGLPAECLQTIKQELVASKSTIAPPSDWHAPASVPLLRDLLRLEVNNRKLAQWSDRDRLQAEVDALHDAVQHQRASVEQRLKDLKLRALAELAAGAGHEINNPLAVISGQAQYLLLSEQEPARRKALQTIVGQTQRIHQTLNQLMQFARPPAPRKQRVDLGGLLSEVTVSLQSLADEKQVRIVAQEWPTALTLFVDPARIRTAVSGLLRNAIEAAPPGGWAKLRVECNSIDGITLVVEDNGPGPKGADREHLFDPFYSGRKAGRGPGMGLPAAWQLARQHGGDVRLQHDGDEVTRFVLTLPPDAIAEELPIRIVDRELRIAN